MLGTMLTYVLIIQVLHTAHTIFVNTKNIQKSHHLGK